MTAIKDIKRSISTWYPYASELNQAFIKSSFRSDDLFSRWFVSISIMIMFGQSDELHTALCEESTSLQMAQTGRVESVSMARAGNVFSTTERKDTPP